MAIDRNAVNWFKRYAYISFTCLFFLLIQTQTVFGQVGRANQAIVSATDDDRVYLVGHDYSSAMMRAQSRSSTHVGA